MACIETRKRRMTGRKLRRKHRKVKKEIERRFLIKYLPEHVRRGLEEGAFTMVFIMQGYSDDKKGERFRREIAASKLKTSYVKTFKTGEGLARPEDNRKMRTAAFCRQWGKKVKFSLLKDRHFIPYAKWTIELNFFRQANGKNVDYVQAEVEFKTISGSRKFIPPDWFDREVTSDPCHSSYCIAKNGVPEDI